MFYALNDLHVRLWPLQPKSGRTKCDFLSLHELTRRELEGLLDLAAEMKASPAGFRYSLAGCTAALIFEKPSLRTHVTFEVALLRLGGHAIYLAPGDVGLGKRESVKDVARNLARWVDAIVVRTFAHSLLEEMAVESSVPVINALSDFVHPCQALADLLTLREHKGRLKGLRLAFIGDGNNVALSLAQAAAKTGMDFVLSCPPGYELDARASAQARADAELSGAELSLIHNPLKAVMGADAVYTDVWASMGQESEAAERRRVFAPYQVNRGLMEYAKPDALFMHCLPAHRGEEVTDEVLDGGHSVVLEQAENRLHVAGAVLLALLGDSRRSRSLGTDARGEV